MSHTVSSSVLHLSKEGWGHCSSPIVTTGDHSRKISTNSNWISSSLHPQLYFICTHYKFTLANDITPLNVFLCILNSTKNGEIIREQNQTGWKVEKSFVFIYLHGYMHSVTVAQTIQIAMSVPHIPVYRSRNPADKDQVSRQQYIYKSSLYACIHKTLILFG